MPGEFFLSSGYWVTMSFLSHCPYLDLTFPQFMCALFSASYLVLLPSLSVEVVLITSFLSHLTVLHASYLPSTFACPHMLNHSCFSNHVLLLNAASSAKNWFILFVFYAFRLQKMWDELDLWHSKLNELDSEVQDIVEQDPGQAQEWMDKLMIPFQQYQQVSQRAESRTSQLNKVWL